MMKYLMNKEMKLSLHETNFIFLLMAFMLLIPNYPFYVAFFFPCLGIFYLFLNGREQNDIYFSALLPVCKKDVVKSRFMTVAGIQIVQVVLSLPVAILRYKLMGLPNEAGIEANVAFYGLVFVMYAIFNVLFLPQVYKSPEKVGKPFVLAGIVQLLFIALMEALIHVAEPVKNLLDTVEPDMMVRQIPVLVGGMLVYTLTMLLCYRASAKSFEKIDL